MFSWFTTSKRSITPLCGFIWQKYGFIRCRDHVSFWLGTGVMTNGLMQALKFKGWKTSCKYKQENQLKNQICVAISQPEKVSCWSEDRAVPAATGPEGYGSHLFLPGKKSFHSQLLRNKVHLLFKGRIFPFWYSLVIAKDS